MPAAVIERLLRDRPPEIVGVGVAGMPAGAAGMESPKPAPYDVMAWRPSGETSVYAKVGADGKITY